MIYICIVTHNRAAALGRLLDAVLDLDASDLRVMVLDQATDWDSPLTQLRHESVAYWRSKQYLNSSAARQRLVDLLAHHLHMNDVLVFLDDDVEPVAQDWLGKLVSPFANSRVLVSGANGRIVTRDWLTEPGEGQAIDYVGGGWMAVRATAFLKAGIEWSHDYPNTYYDDVDFCLQVKARGMTVWNCGDVGLKHDHGVTSPEQGAWVARNREICRRKWAGRGLVLHEVTHA